MYMNIDIKPITPRQFRQFQELIRKEAGIQLADIKQALLVHRLSRRVRDLNLDSFGDYYEQIEGNPSELQQMLNCICTNETQFFREPYQFDFIRDVLIPDWKRKAAIGSMSRNIRAWCAACSTGEEPYSLAMLLLEALPQTEGWNIEILATDISTRVLNHATEAVWPIEKADSIPGHLLKRFCLKGYGSQSGKMMIGKEASSVVRFARLNLNEHRYPATGKFQMIFCRNALIYFGTEDRQRVIHQLLQHLEPSGYFFLGHAESLSSMSVSVHVVKPTIYKMPENEES